METMTLDRSSFLRRVLCADAATCIASGLLMSAGAAPLARLLGLPAGLLFWAGVALFPVAAFILVLALRHARSVAGAWIVILGNVAWVAGSLLVLLLAPTALGTVFVISQAIVVAVLAELEYVGLRRIG